MKHDRFDLRRPDVFKTRITENVMLPGEGTKEFVPAVRAAPDSVRVDQTPHEALLTHAANYPRYDLLDVQNLPNRKRV